MMTCFIRYAVGYMGWELFVPIAGCEEKQHKISPSRTKKKWAAIHLYHPPKVCLNYSTHVELKGLYSHCLRGIEDILQSCSLFCV